MGVPKCSPSLHWPKKSQLTLQGKSPDVMETRHESQETGACFNCRNKDIGWCALKHIHCPSPDQPKPGKGCLVPFQKFRAVAFPMGHWLPLPSVHAQRKRALKLHGIVDPSPLFCSLPSSCCVTRMTQALMSDTWCQVLAPPTAYLSGFRFL